MSVFFLNVCVFAIGHLCETHIYIGEGGVEKNMSVS